MTENKTEALKKKLDEEKAEREAKRISEEKMNAESPKEQTKKAWVMPAFLPVLLAVICWVILYLVMSHKPLNTLIITLLAVVVWWLLDKARKSSIKKNFTTVKEYTDEIAGKLSELQDLVVDRAKAIKNPEMKESLGAIAMTVSRIAEEVEHDPKDRNKVRKLANYYGDMLLGLVDKYIKMQNNARQAIEGENVESSMSKIEEAVKGAEVSVKKLLDSLFSEDAMEINAEINTLDKLMKLELDQKKGEDQ